MNPESTPIENDQQIIIDYLRKMDISEPETIITGLPVDSDVGIYNFLSAPLIFATSRPEIIITKVVRSIDSQEAKTVISTIASIINKASTDQATIDQQRHAYMVTSLIFGSNPDGGSKSTINDVLQQSDHDTFNHLINLLSNPESMLCNQEELIRMIGGPNSQLNRAARYRLVQLFENGLQSTDSVEQEQWNDLKNNPKRCLEYLKTMYANTQ